jgi:hypothetical protein
MIERINGQGSEFIEKVDGWCIVMKRSMSVGFWSELTMSQITRRMDEVGYIKYVQKFNTELFLCVGESKS